MSKDINAALNDQIGQELLASIQYLGIATYFDTEGLPALARHFYRQSVEERNHAMRFVRFIVDAGGRVSIPAIPKTESTFRSAEEAVQLSLEQERSVTRMIHELVDLAIRQKDHVTRNFLEWFVKEQLQEVSSMETLVRMIKRAGERGLLFVESYLQGNQAVAHEAGPDTDAE